MNYQRGRSLCWNIAKNIGMPEAMMREATNASQHLKCRAHVANGSLQARDFIISKTGALVMISVIARDNSNYVDYMVADAPMEMYSSIDEAIDKYSDWAASNALYFNKMEYGHMAKVEALYEVSNLTGGTMYPPSGW